VSARRREAAGTPRVLVIDDSEGVRSYLAQLLELRRWAVDTASDGRRGLALLEAGAAPDVVLLDVLMPELDGLATLGRLRQEHPGIPVVMLSVVGKAETIVEAMRLGAHDYLNKPFEEEELLTALEAARDGSVRTLGAEDDGAGEGPLWQGALAEVRELLERVADTDVTVMLLGESGVGKEIVARAVHETSSRRAGPFVKVNCAALPGELLESELFGHEKGAFTGALQRKAGKFEQAEGGTIFLDEIGEMSSALQAKLLHVLQDGSFTRLGGNHEHRADARVVTATHRDLAAMTAGGQFREDLYFRLNVVTVRIPPLRERPDELPALIDHFLARSARRYAKPRPELSPRLLGLLGRYPFPGNVRELENLIKRVVVFESEEPVLGALVHGGERSGARGLEAFTRVLDEMEASAGELPLRDVGRRAALEAEREAIERVLHQTSWNRKRAAGLLGVSYKTLLQKIRDCGLEPS
jgi:two-component system response regulator AtoC